MKYKIILIGIILSSITMIGCNKTIVKKEPATDSVSIEQPTKTVIETTKYIEFNQRVRKAKNINTPVELIKYYYGEIDTYQDVDIVVEQPEVSLYNITLIQENIKDDSISGMKVVMLAKQVNSQWTVLDIQRTWKCHDGRGHAGFNSEMCN